MSALGTKKVTKWEGGEERKEKKRMAAAMEHREREEVAEGDSEEQNPRPHRHPRTYFQLFCSILLAFCDFVKNLELLLLWFGFLPDQQFLAILSQLLRSWAQHMSCACQ